MRDDYEDYDEDEAISRWIFHIILKRVLPILACGIVAFNSFTIIETGERGVVLRLGEYKYNLNEGFNFKFPFIDKGCKTGISGVTGLPPSSYSCCV